MNHAEIKQHLMEAESAEEAAAIVRECGEELSAEQADRLFQEIQLRKAALANPEELDEKELEAVTDGFDLYKLPGICKGSIEVRDWSIDSQGKVSYFATHSSCWFGADYCKLIIETYGDYNTTQLN